MTETKRQRFVRVAERRTNAVLEKLRVLGNCSNRAMYEYTPNDIDLIFKSIKQALKDVESMFLPKSEKRFKLEG